MAKFKVGDVVRWSMKYDSCDAAKYACPIVVVEAARNHPAHASFLGRRLDGQEIGAEPVVWRLADDNNEDPYVSDFGYRAFTIDIFLTAALRSQETDAKGDNNHGNTREQDQAGTNPAGT